MTIPLLLSLAAQAGGSPPVVKLNGPLVQPLVSGVDGALVTADGAWTVFRGDFDTDGVLELYSAPLEGLGPRRKLNPPLGPGDRIVQFAIVPGEREVLFTLASGLWRAPIDGGAAAVRLGAPGDLVTTFWLDPLGARALCYSHTLESFRLFAVSLDGTGTAVTLDSGPLHGSAQVFDLVVSVDGQRALYARGSILGRQELRSVPIDGSQPALRLDPGPGLDRPEDFQLEPGGMHVVFRMDAEEPEHFELFRAPVDGSAAPRRLSGVLGPDADVAPLTLPSSAFQNSSGTFAFVPGGRHCAYLADALVDGENRLFVAALDGWRPSDLGAPSPVSSLCIAPDGQSVLYLSTGGELYTASIGRSPVHRRLTNAADGAVTPFRPVEFAQDGKVVVFSRLDPDGVHFRLHAVDAAGTSVARRLSDEPDVVHRVTPDGQRVLYGTIRGASGAELFSVAPDGSQLPRRLSRHLTAIANQGFQFFTADRPPGKRVVFLDGGDVASASVEGGKYRRLSGPLLGPTNADVSVFRLTPDGRNAVYTADEDGSGADLHVVPSDGSALPRRLTDSLEQGRTLFGFQLSPDGRWAVDPFAGPGTGMMLRSVELGGKPEARRLSAALPAGRDLGGRTVAPFEFSFRISPDSKRVLYAADQDTDDVVELYSAPIDASRPAVRLNPAFSGTRDLFLTRYQPAFESDSRSERVLYLANQDQVGKVELYSVPIDGGTAIRLHPALGAGRNVRSFALAPDGERVLYVADVTTPFQFELFSVPIAGGAAPIRVNGSLGVGGNVGGQNPDWIAHALAFLPGGRVVYRADPEHEEFYQLFVAPIDGSSAPVELPLLHPAESVELFFVATPDGTRVVYLSNRIEGSDRVYELYSVACDGSSPPLRLNRPLVPGGDVGFDSFERSGVFLLGAGGTRVVYVAEEQQRFRFDLFSVPVDRSAAPVRLSDGSSDVQPGFFGLSPDGGHVFFRDGRRLHLVPVDGSTPPRLLFDELATTGSVLVQLTSGAAQALFLADPDVPGRVELYSSLIGGAARLPGLTRR